MVLGAMSSSRKRNKSMADGDSSSSNEEDSQGRKYKRARKNLSNEQKDALEAVFSSDPFPSPVVKQQLANRTGLTYNKIVKWFDNRRTKARKSGALVPTRRNQYSVVSSPRDESMAEAGEGSDESIGEPPVWERNKSFPGATKLPLNVPQGFGSLGSQSSGNSPTNVYRSAMSPRQVHSFQGSPSSSALSHRSSPYNSPHKPADLSSPLFLSGNLLSTGSNPKSISTHRPMELPEIKGKEWPDARCSHCAVMQGSFLNIWGGVSRDGSFRPWNEIWSISMDKIESTTTTQVEWNVTYFSGQAGVDFPHPRTGASFVEHKPTGHVYCYGGQVAVLCANGRTAYVSDNHIWKLDLKKRKWTEIIPRTNLQPFPREGHSAVFRGNRMIVFAGRAVLSNQLTPQVILSKNSENLLGDLWAFNFETCAWEEVFHSPERDSRPAPRCYHVGEYCSQLDEMFVIGGLTNQTEDVVLYTFSFAKSMWSAAKGPICGQDGWISPSSVFDELSKTLVVLGGEIGNGHGRYVAAYHPERKHWNIYKTKDVSLSFSPASSYKNRIVLFGGKGNQEYASGLDVQEGMMIVRPSYGDKW